MWASLPGIDGTDRLKTHRTLSWLSTLFNCVPLIDATKLDGLPKPGKGPGPVEGKLNSTHTAVTEDQLEEHSENARR